MTFLNNLKFWIHSLFWGLSDADKVIQGQDNEPNEKTVGIHQVKDTQRVSHALLRGEITKSVAELRYRDYLVSENSRNYHVFGDEAVSTTDNILINERQIPKKFGGVNHEICNGFSESDSPTKYTLKFEYFESIKFPLDKFCVHFLVEENFISLYFSLLPNRNVATSKAFSNYLNKLIVSSNDFGAEYKKLKSISFTTYKISAVANYIKFTFKNLLLSDISVVNNEFVLKYAYESKEIENLLEKYTSEELKKKYETKEEKHLPQDVNIFEIANTCQLCGKPISVEEGASNKSIVGKFCCTDCLTKTIINNPNDTL